MRCLTFSELLAIYAILITIIFGISAFFLPEFRRWIGLDKSSIKIEAPTTPEVIARIFIIILILIMICLFGWFIWCKIPDVPKKPKKDTPTPIATQIPVPTATPIIETPPPTVVINGTKFELYVFNSDYYWVAGKDDVHTLRGILTGTNADDQMVAYLRDIHGDMKKKDAIICVGTASFNMTLKGKPFEEGRAQNRAKIITDWMRKVFKDADRSPALYQLNLGHYGESPDSNDQRLIVIVGVERMETDAPAIKDILSPENQENLKQKLIEKGFPFNFDKYSLFNLRSAS